MAMARCALAFLESAQSWGGELRVLARPAPGPDVRLSSAMPACYVVPQGIVGAADRWGRAARVGLAMAATFLLAFGLGWVIRQPARGPGADDGMPAQPNIGALADAGAPPTKSTLSGSAQAADRWETVTLVMDDGGGKREVQIAGRRNGLYRRFMARSLRTCRAYRIARSQLGAAWPSHRRAAAISAGESRRWPPVGRAGR